MGEADLALDIVQSVATGYFEEHGRLPDEETMTRESFAELKRQGAVYDPEWRFSSTGKESASSESIMLSVHGGEVERRTYGYTLDESSFRAGLAVRTGRKAPGRG